MRNHLIVGLALAVALIASACGTTRVVTNIPNARIYVDGVEVASNKLRMRGAPGTTTIEVVAPDGRRIVKQVRRSFTGVTFIAGLLTYGIGFFAAWELPGAVMFYFDESQPVAAANSWDSAPAPAHDAWQVAPNGHSSPGQTSSPGPSDAVWGVSEWPEARRASSTAPGASRKASRARASDGFFEPGYDNKPAVNDPAVEEAARKRACRTWRSHWKSADAAGRAALQAGKPNHCETDDSSKWSKFDS